MKAAYDKLLEEVCFRFACKPAMVFGRSMEAGMVIRLVFLVSVALVVAAQVLDLSSWIVVAGVVIATGTFFIQDNRRR
jgi:hypothetical protein